MIHPRESEQFGFFKDGSDKELVLMRDTTWYAADSFGLKSLDKAGKIDFYNTTGDHLRFTQDFWKQMVTKYFNGAPIRAESYLSGGSLKLTWQDCGDSSTHTKITAVTPSSLTLGATTTITG